MVIYKFNVASLSWITSWSFQLTNKNMIVKVDHFPIWVKIEKRWVQSWDIKNHHLPSLKLTVRTWKWMVGMTRLNFLLGPGLFSGAFVVSFREGRFWLFTLPTTIIKTPCLPAFATFGNHGTMETKKSFKSPSGPKPTLFFKPTTTYIIIYKYHICVKFSSILAYIYININISTVSFLQAYNLKTPLLPKFPYLFQPHPPKKNIRFEKFAQKSARPKWSSKVKVDHHMVDPHSEVTQHRNVNFLRWTLGNVPGNHPWDRYICLHLFDLYGNCR